MKITKVHLEQCYNGDLFEGNLNRRIKTLTDDGAEILSIQFSAGDNSNFKALIVYKIKE